MSAVDHSLVAGLLQSTRVNELADTIGVPADHVHKVLAALGEMPARLMVEMCGTEAVIVNEAHLRHINRATRKAEPFGGTDR